jgi:NAD(P)-dependent dehydrogenase (short-subunit alcohol dehydrogenase family)
MNRAMVDAVTAVTVGTQLAPGHDMTQAQRAMVGAAAVGVGSLLMGRARRGCDFNGRSVLITGGSRGLGLLIARRLAAESAFVTIAARDAEELDRARRDLTGRGAQIDTVVCDMGVREDAERLVQRVINRTGRLDVLINNAGVMTVGPLDQMDVADFEQAMAVHFWGPLHTMRAALPAMRRQRFGRIVNVASIGGRLAVPHLTPYCCSKFALVGLSDAVRAEVRRDGVYVTTVLPGLMRTGSPFNAWFKGKHRAELAWFLTMDSLPLLSLDGDAAAGAIVDACRHGDAEVVLGWPAKLAVIAGAIAPGLVARVMALTNRYALPSNEHSGRQARSGWQSLSALAPSPLTRLSDRAAVQNNEIPV